MRKQREEEGKYVLYDSKYDKFWRSIKPFVGPTSIEDYVTECPSPRDLLWNVKAPLSMGFMITNKCNAHCLHCFANSGTRGKNELNLKEIGKIVDDLYRNEVFRIDVSGGEPLSRKDFPQIIDLLLARGMSVIVSTNGSLLNKHMSYLEGITALQVSLDSTNPLKHDTFRGYQGLYTKVIHNTSKIKGIPLRIFTVLSKMNTREVKELSSLAYELGAQEHQYLRYLPSGRDQALKEQFELSNEDYQRVQEIIKKLKMDYKNKMIIECIDLSKNDCSYALIKPNGDLVTISNESYEYILAGNLLVKSLAELWTTPPFNKAGHLKLWTDEGIF